MTTIPNTDQVQANVQGGLNEYDYWLIQVSVEQKEQQQLIKNMVSMPSSGSDCGKALWYGTYKVMAHSTDWCGALLALTTSQMDIQGGLSSGLNAGQSYLSLGGSITNAQCDDYAATMQYMYGVIGMNPNGSESQLPGWLSETDRQQMSSQMNTISAGYMNECKKTVPSLTPLNVNDGNFWTPADLSQQIAFPDKPSQSVIQYAQGMWTGGTDADNPSEDTNFSSVVQGYAELSTLFNSWNSQLTATANFDSGQETKFQDAANKLGQEHDSLIQSTISHQKPSADDPGKKK